MRRDHDLIRAIILHVEDYPHGEYPLQIPPIEGYTDEQINYHNYLLLEQGLVHGFPLSLEGDLSPGARIRGLTPAGHTFAEAARNDTVWKRTNELVKQAGGVAFNVFVEMLFVVAKDHAAKFLG